MCAVEPARRAELAAEVKYLSFAAPTSRGTESSLTLRLREMDSNFRWRVKPPATQSFCHFVRCIWGQNRGQYAPLLNGGREMARPASNLHLQPKNGGWRARVLVPVELQGILGKKLLQTHVWRVSKSEAAVLAYPEVHQLPARHIPPLLRAEAYAQTASDRYP